MIEPKTYNCKSNYVRNYEIILKMFLIYNIVFIVFFYI